MLADDRLGHPCGHPYLVYLPRGEGLTLSLREQSDAHLAPQLSGAHTFN